MTVVGLATARGFASGPVFVYRRDGDLSVPEYSIAPERVDGEIRRLDAAMAETARDIRELIDVLRNRTGRADVRVFECHLMLLDDGMLRGETERHISEELVNAEAAVRRTADRARSVFGKMSDPYFRERVRDLDDLERRILKVLAGHDRHLSFDLKEPSIVVADDLTPSETVQLPRDYVLGFATNGGSNTSHVALLARALAIPAVCGLGDITSKVSPGDMMLLDGTNGAVTIRPDAKTRRQFEELVRRKREQAAEAATGRVAGRLRDGGEVVICANVHPGVPVAGVKEYGAHGIGLYRSEYLWLDRDLEPTEEEQFEAYSSAARFVATLPGDASVTIRALDIGGDKLVRGISRREDNPFLGNRSIRYLLTHRDVMRRQLRAILRASAFGRVRIMYPMVSCVEELRDAAEVLGEVRRGLDAEGVAYDRDVPVGAMIEVPAAALNAATLAKYVRFFSIGTNDLVQYTMAADRGNESVAHLYQPLNPAVVKLVRMTVDAAKSNGISVGVCGESAADPIVGTYWAALGVDTLSMSPTYIPAISNVLSRLTRADLDEYAKVPGSLPGDATAGEVLDACRAWLVSKVGDLDGILI
ncbi:MAG: phosphoenolpyruvate--protein phosphotransferase [Kiritimatiellae bacterium]|nr:phosphoenolpyruvate--protein phosphotransferase [Kiritimatiellia bacterium]